jgi:cytochrome b
METVDDAVAAGGTMLPAAIEPGRSAATVRVWDPLVRLFHWALVACFVVAWTTADDARQVHELAGYAIIGLIIVRIAWGFVGTKHARFSDFVQGPAVVLRHLADASRFRSKRYLGHNPAGGAMILALLVMLSIICASGFAMTTDAFWGVRWVETIHEAAVNLTLILIALHLAGVGTGCFEHRENLVRAMITGRKSIATLHRP